MKDAPAGVQLFFDLVSKFYNDAPLSIVYQELMFPTDDTVQYIFEGEGDKKESFSIVSLKSKEQAGTRAKYKISTSKHMMGMRVKPTYTFSAAGIAAALFITVMELSERELPRDTSVRIKIDGLCVGGGGITLGNNDSGTVMFIRGKKGANVERYRIYQDKVLIPFVKKSHMLFHGWNEGNAIPLELMAVSWSDGDITQIQNIVTPESLEVYRNNMITANKQNPQHTGTE